MRGSGCLQPPPRRNGSQPAGRGEAPGCRCRGPARGGAMARSAGPVRTRGVLPRLSPQTRVPFPEQRQRGREEGAPRRDLAQRRDPPGSEREGSDRLFPRRSPAGCGTRVRRCPPDVRGTAHGLLSAALGRRFSRGDGLRGGEAPLRAAHGVLRPAVGPAAGRRGDPDPQPRAPAGGAERSRRRC